MARRKITNESSSRRAYKEAGANRLTISSQKKPRASRNSGGNAEVSAGNTTPRTRGAASYKAGRARLSEGRNQMRADGRSFRAVRRAGLTGNRSNR